MYQHAQITPKILLPLLHLPVLSTTGHPIGPAEFPHVSIPLSTATPVIFQRVPAETRDPRTKQQEQEQEQAQQQQQEKQPQYY